MLIMPTRPTVLLAASKWWPLAARLAVALDRQGCEVQALCPAHHLLEAVPAVRKTYRYGARDSLGSLRCALERARPDLIVPCDDGVSAQLHALHARDAAQRPLIERSLGPPESYPVIDGRFELLSLADELGIRVPRHRRITAAAELADWHDEVSPVAVVKVDGEAGGNGVCISRNLADSIAAFERFRAPPGALMALKRAHIDRDPLASWGRSQTSRRAVSVQAFVPGRPANSMLACWRGKLLGIVSVAVVVADGPTGVASVVRVINDDRMRGAAELLAARLRLSGFYGLDFIIESGSDLPYLIEMNPRCTQLGHLEIPRSCSLAGALAAALMDRPPAMATQPLRSDLVALFPQALRAGDAVWPYVASGHHDVPDDANLRRELSRDIWPRRRWISRLYHAFHVPLRPEPALFEGLEAVAAKPVERKTRSVA
jgi:hypothetical protein